MQTKNKIKQFIDDLNTLTELNVAVELDTKSNNCVWISVRLGYHMVTILQVYDTRLDDNTYEKELLIQFQHVENVVRQKRNHQGKMQCQKTTTININEYEFDQALEQVKDLFDPSDKVEVYKERYFKKERDVPFGRFMIDYRSSEIDDRYKVKVIQIDYYFDYSIDILVTIMFSLIEKELRKNHINYKTIKL